MSNREIVLELVKTHNKCDIYLGRRDVVLNYCCYKTNSKYDNIQLCWICKTHITTNQYIMSKNNNTIKYRLCSNCKNKTLCFTCFREKSSCSIIYSRKLLCYKFLLSQKFPKDIIRFITKKVK